MTDLSTTPGLIETCWRYCVLGIVQGLTEFLPISSTAHLKVVPMILGWDDPGVAVTAVFQLGSIGAVIAYFRKDLARVLKGISLAILRGQWREPNARLGVAICTGTIPILLAGMSIKFFWPAFGNSQLRSIHSIGLISIVMALLLALSEQRNIKKKSLLKISLRDGLLIGLAQMLAIIPGVSRSGVTLTASMLDGWNREEAARFSFLLGIPAISLAGLVELKDAFTPHTSTGVIPLIFGLISAAVVSWLTIDWLLSYLRTHKTWIFVSYRLIFGVGLLFWLWAIPSK